ncbi:MAG: ABC transporter permease [Oceanicoccus sp.]
MKEFLAVFVARNKEFYRDKGSLSWSFIFPILIIVVCAFAFANPDKTLFKVGTVGNQHEMASLALLQQPFIEKIVFTDLDQALKRVQHHQLDLLVSIDDDSKNYWINTESSNSLVAEQLFTHHDKDFIKQETSGSKVRYVDWVIPGVLGMNLMFGALFGIGYVIVRYRQNGVLKRLQATPVSPLKFLSAQLASRLVIVVSVNVIIFIGCNVFLDLIIVGSYTSLFLVTVLGGLAMISIGLLISCRTANEELAGGLLNIVSFPMMFVSEVWFSLDNAPEWLLSVSNLIPLTHIVKATRSIMIDGATLADVSYHLVSLIGITIICLGLASFLFKWTKSD